MIFKYIRTKDIEAYRQQGWAVTFWKMYGVNEMSFIAELKIDELDARRLPGKDEDDTGRLG